MSRLDETIVAIASPVSPAMRGIVRVSGEHTLQIIANVGVKVSTLRGARRLEADIDLGEPLGVVASSVLVWPDGRCYTGEPSAEFHTFGCLPILQALVDRLISAGARVARPGEFTLRAFLAGRLDLTQAEAVLGVIDAENRGALNSALRQLAGNFSRPLERMRSEMLDLLADVEAGMDFVDEDIQFISDDSLNNRLQSIADELQMLHRTLVARGESTSQTLVAFRGRPNAGKSRLINSLAGHEASIVTEVAGTTRDCVSVDVDFFGHTIRMIDTAGIETIDHEVSRAAQAQAEQAMQDADIRVWCFDLSSVDTDLALEELRLVAASAKPNRVDLWLGTKTDTIDLQKREEWTKKLSSLFNSEQFLTSSVSGENIEILRQRILHSITARNSSETGCVLGTAARCSESLLKSAESIQAAIELSKTLAGHEFVASELRIAIECIGEVTGAVYTDDLLDRVFSRFCIGK